MEGSYTSYYIPAAVLRYSAPSSTMTSLRSISVKFFLELEHYFLQLMHVLSVFLLL